MLPVLLSNHLAGILQPPSLVDSGPCQASKMESFVRVVVRINYSRWKPIVFYDGGTGGVGGGGGGWRRVCAEVN